MKKIILKNFIFSMLFLASFMLEKGRASDGCFKEHKDCAEALEFFEVRLDHTIVISAYRFALIVNLDVKKMRIF